MTTTDPAEELREALGQIFAQLAEIPDAAVARIVSHEVAEDGRTLVVMAELEDGRTMVVSACPGEPLAISVHE